LQPIAKQKEQIRNLISILKESKMKILLDRKNFGVQIIFLLLTHLIYLMGKILPIFIEFKREKNCTFAV